VDIETIGLNIRKCRNAKKMRQEDLAQKANVSSNYISAVERGVKIPSVETLIDIMNALGVSADMIFCDVIDAGVTEKNNQLDAKVSQLSTKDRKTVYDVLDLLVRDLSKKLQSSALRRTFSYACIMRKAAGKGCFFL